MNEEAPALDDQQKIDAIWEMLAIVAGDQQGEKVGYAAFVAEYFAGEPIHEPTARNFYEDYLASTYSLPEYIQQTTSVL